MRARSGFLVQNRQHWERIAALQFLRMWPIENWHSKDWNFR